MFENPDQGCISQKHCKPKLIIETIGRLVANMIYLYDLLCLHQWWTGLSVIRPTAERGMYLKIVIFWIMKWMNESGMMESKWEEVISRHTAECSSCRIWETANVGESQVNPTTPIKWLGEQRGSDIADTLEINACMNKSIMAVSGDVCINKWTNMCVRESMWKARLPFSTDATFPVNEKQTRTEGWETDRCL